MLSAARGARYRGAGLAVCAFQILSAVPAHAAAPEGGGGAPGEVEEIIVTAQRRNQNLQDVPISITAVTAAQAEHAGLVRTDDLALIVPSLNLTRNSNGLTPFLRGVGTLSSSPGQESSVPLYIDGIYVPQPTATLFSFNNIERIEVLKGPQGTLFGRNASGGLIHIITRDPGQETVLKGGISYGNYNTLEGRAYAATPIGADAAVDIAAYGFDRGGGFGHNLLTGEKTGQHEEYGARSKLKADISDRVGVRLTADLSHVRSDMGTARRLLAGAKGSSGFVQPGGYYDISSTLYPQFKTKNRGASLQIDIEGDPFDVIALSGYRNVRSAYILDTDGQPAFLAHNAIHDYAKNFSQEVQIKSKKSSPIEWIAGIYYFSYDAGFRPFTQLSPTATRSDFVDQTLDSVAGFAQTTIPVLARTNVTLGGRYTSDTRKFRAVSPLASRTVRPVSADFGVWSWRAAVDQKIGDDALLFVSASSGFKAGLFDPLTPRSVPVNPEKATAYETGLKTSLLNRRVRLNFSAFYYRLSNIQLSATLGSTALLLNAATARVYGGEIEGSAAVSKELGINFGASFLDSRYVRFPNSQITRPNPAGGNISTFGDVGGNRTTRAPKLSTTIGINYSRALAVGTIGFSVNHNYQSRFYWTPDNRVAEPGHHIVNAELRFATPSGRWEARVFARNLLDTKYAITTTTSALGDIYSPAAPFTFGAGLNFDL